MEILHSVPLVMIAGTTLLLSGCGDSCESIQDEIQDIGMEVQKDPASAMDRSDELEALRDKLQEMGCQ
ncbi:MAG: hypothetical protein OQL28_07700 [Sedimenticola sp.]|nr:hypothetical protein [Sedimenticola sp.]